jgi:hypothetical protein
MTIGLPKQNLGDRILAFLGKRRAVYIPTAAHKTYGPYVYTQAQRESFIRALLRAKNTALPEGWIYLDALPSVDPD